MTDKTELKLTQSCKFEASKYFSGSDYSVSLEYIEHSPDPWYSDSCTSIDIDKETAIRIINFLQKTLDI